VKPRFLAPGAALLAVAALSAALSGCSSSSSSGSSNVAVDGPAASRAATAADLQLYVPCSKLVGQAITADEISAAWCQNGTTLNPIVSYKCPAGTVVGALQEGTASWLSIGGKKTVKLSYPAGQQAIKGCKAG
jgi:hypothetical protein